jgi:hypothetical protein
MEKRRTGMSKQIPENERRLFLKTLILGAAALVAAPLIRVSKAFAEGAAALVGDKDPLATALGYVADAKKAKDRKDKKANCASCLFYSDATGKAKQGKCQLIATGEVLGAGWCRSYQARAKKA